MIIKIKLLKKITIFAWIICWSVSGIASQSLSLDNSDPRCKKSVSAKKYYYGTDYPQNYMEATKQFREAPLEDCGEAQFYLGKIYFEGLGTLTNFEDAYLWFSLSAANGFVGSVELRDQVKAKLSNRTLISAQNRALDIYKTLQRISN